MRQCAVSAYRCPGCLAPLELTAPASEGDVAPAGVLRCSSGHEFALTASIPDLVWPKELPASDEKARQEYDALADRYEVYAPLPFLTYRVDEWETRRHMVDLLRLQENSTVLEIGCGTGRSTKYIAEKVPSGLVYAQEIAPRILDKAVVNLAEFGNVEYSVANGVFLPFPDDTFDAAHHFGGLNTFSDIRRCLAELARVTRPGGRVVVGDEGMGPWLRDTDFAKIMMNSNPLLAYHPPVDLVPLCARYVTVEWIVLGAFYLLSFTVGAGAPEADYHLQIPSARGGSHWSRYHGQLEGVTDEAKELALAARERSGKSMHQWLDEVVREAARRELRQADGE